MILRELHVDGFGKLEHRTIAFDPVFNVVYGCNEAGKSTLGAALLASLYGLGRGEKNRYRPWSGARYATRLTYALADGRTFEVQREFERDAKGVRVYDAAGNDASAQCAVGKVVSPGHAHLGVPVEVFVNAAFVAQGDAAIDGARAERITHALAHALDGGPKEDAALGAVQRLDNALATHVGTKRATVNAPLRRIYDEIAEAQTRADDVRARLRALGELRARFESDAARSGRREAALREAERRGRSLRSFTIRSRLDALREIRDDLAALQAERALYADAADFPVAEVGELEALFREAHTLEALAHSHAEEAERARMTPALQAEFDERDADGGSPDEAAFAGLRAAAAEAASARDRASVAAERVQVARRALDDGRDVVGGALAATVFIALGTGALVYAKLWLFAALVGLAAVALGLFTYSIENRRRSARRTVRSAQRAADDACEAERAAGQRVRGVLGPLGATSVDDLARRRARALELRARHGEATRLAERAAQTRDAARAAGDAFDALARRLVVPSGARERDLAGAKARAARRSARDGIELRLSMLGVRRSDVLGADDEFALESELAQLDAAGVESVAGAVSPRAFEAERAALERRVNDGRIALAAVAAELRSAEAASGDLAGLEERVHRLRARAARLEAFEAAVTLARETIEERTREAHQKFARRLADYASRTLARVSDGRYHDVRVDPTTLAVRVRVPETGEIVDVDRLSAGTREQAYLVTRLAMVRMFAEGLETAPLLLDDPFAFWDDARIDRCLPILVPGTGPADAQARDAQARDAQAPDAQVVLFTTSAALVRAAAARGARTIDLSFGGDVAGSAVRALHGDEDLPLVTQA